MDANVTLNSKLDISVPELKFLGHLVGSDGVKIDHQKLSAIIEMKVPSNITEVRCLLGMTNQLAKFSLWLAELSIPIRELLHKNTSWIWASLQEEAFSKIKAAICSAPALALCGPNKPKLICAYASSFGLGGTLFQKQTDNSWRPVTFVSRSLTEAEKYYAQIEKEALAITWTCERLADYLVGLQFHIHMDHKPLIYLFSTEKSFDAVPPWIQRFRLRMMRFDFSISYVPGTTLCTADGLSRFPIRDVKSNVPDIDIFVSSNVKSLPKRDVIIDEIRTATTSDCTLQIVINHCQIGWPEISILPPDVQKFAHSCVHFTECDGLLMYGTYIVVPFSLRKKILDAFHDAHQGIVKSLERARSSVL